jgi:hypothetical protein
MSLVQAFTLFAQITTATMIIPIIVASVYSKKINRSQRIFLYYLIGAFVIAFLARVFVWSTGAYKDFWMPYLNKWNLHDSNFISIAAYLFNFGLLGWYFSSVFDSERIQKKIKIVSAILFVFAIIDNFFIHDWRAYNSDVATASAIYCALLPLIHLGSVYRTLTEITVQKNPYFWIDLGFIVPNVLGLFLHFVGDTLFETDKILYYQISIVKYCFVIIAQFFFAYNFYLARLTKYLPNKW